MGTLKGDTSCRGSPNPACDVGEGEARRRPYGGHRGCLVPGVKFSSVTSDVSWMLEGIFRYQQKKLITELACKL
jgi:hypothetical protein